MVHCVVNIAVGRTVEIFLSLREHNQLYRPLLSLSRDKKEKRSDMLKSQVPVDPKVMRYLDYLGLGMEKKKVERGRKLRLYRRWVID